MYLKLSLSPYRLCCEADKQLRHIHRRKSRLLAGQGQPDVLLGLPREDNTLEGQHRHVGAIWKLRYHSAVARDILFSIWTKLN